MNRYFDFFCKMNDEEWEHFAVDVLRSAGFSIQTIPAYGTDGGKDFLVSNDDTTYIVSCKHYIRSGNHVGQDDEKNISDRMVQFNAGGFIGFYSTEITTSLQNRLDAICANKNYKYLIFGPQQIIRIMQYMDTIILQTYGLYPHKYYMNVHESEYKPLKCMMCGRDILLDENIPNSLAGVARYKMGGKYEYVYGCKPCFINVELFCNAHLELEQALHIRQLQGWEELVDEWIENGDIAISDTFHKNRNRFLNRVRQRQLPQTDGTWYGLDF